MYIGKKYLLDAIKVLASDKVKFETVDLLLTNGSRVICKEVLLDGAMVIAREYASNKWLYMPDQEVIGFSVELEGETTLAKVIELSRKAVLPTAAESNPTRAVRR